MSTETRKPGPEQTENPLAIFDEALSTVASEVREAEIKPKKQKKQEKEEVIKATTERAQTFEQLAREGTYEQLRGTSFEVFLTAVARELGKEAPADLEKKLADLKGIDDRLAKYDKLVEAVKNEPRMKAAAETLHQNAETIMKEWAALLHEQFKELTERNSFELQTTDASIREILDSSIFTAEVEAQDETYEDYKRRTSETLVEGLTTGFRSSVETKAFEGALKKNFSPNVKEFLEYNRAGYLGGKLSRTEIEEQIKLFNDKAMQGQITISNRTGNYVFRGNVAVREALPEVSRELERVTNAGEIAKASLETLAEEKMRKIIEIIEEELDSEDERHSALEYVKQYFPQVSMGALTTSHGGGQEQQIAILKLPAREADEKEIPAWLLRCLREYNEVKIFEKMTLPKENLGGIRNNLVIDQMLRTKTGEKSFGDTETTVSEEPSYHGTLLRAKLPEKDKIQSWRDMGELPPKLTLDQKLIIRATATTELLDGNGLYDYQDKEALKTVRVILAQSSTNAPFDRERGEPQMYDRGQTTEIKNWKEEVDSRRHVQKPTSREEIDRVIAANDGVYPIATVNEGIRLIDAFRAKIVDALHRAEEGKLAGEQGRTAGQQEAQAAQGQIKELRGQLEETGRARDSQKDEAGKQRQRAEKAEADTKGVKAELSEKNKEVRNLKRVLGELVVAIDQGTASVGEISGLMGVEGRKRATLEKLLAGVKEKLQGLA